MIHQLKNMIRVMRTDPHMREVAYGTMLAFTLKVVGSGLTFAFNVVVARILGAEGAGLYFLALAITTISSVVGRVGLDNALLRFIATRASHEDWEGVKGVHALGIRIVILASGALAVAMFLTAPWISSGVFNKPELSEPLRWMSLSILPFSLLNLQAESFKGLNHVSAAMAVQSIGVPLTGLMLIVPLAHLAGVLGVATTYALSTSLVAIVSLFAWRRATVPYGAIAGRFSFKELWNSCRPLWGVSILNGAILPWMPLFLLGVWATSEDVGIYGAALRVSMLVSFFLVSINNIVAPKFASLFVRGDIETLGIVARRSAILLMLFASPLLLLMLLAGDKIMGLYGPNFSEGSIVLAILAIGQMVNAFCGPAGNLLTMTGYEHKLRNSTLVALVVLAVVSILMIPLYGMEGAAVATAMSVIVNNLSAVFYVRHSIGIAYPLKLGRNRA